MQPFRRLGVVRLHEDMLGFAMREDAPVDDEDSPIVSTGNHGLDDILGGGFDTERLYLFEGQPGSGKTTLALQFPLEGVRRDVFDSSPSASKNLPATDSVALKILMFEERELAKSDRTSTLLQSNSLWQAKNDTG